MTIRAAASIGADPSEGYPGSRLSLGASPRQIYENAVKFASLVGQRRCRFVTYLRPKAKPEALRRYSNGQSTAVLRTQYLEARR